MLEIINTLSCEKKINKPLLIIEKLPKEFGNQKHKDSIKKQKLSNSEEELLTLIANIIIQIILNSYECNRLYASKYKRPI